MLLSGGAQVQVVLQRATGEWRSRRGVSQVGGRQAHRRGAQPPLVEAALVGASGGSAQISPRSGTAPALRPRWPDSERFVCLSGF